MHYYKIWVLITALFSLFSVSFGAIIKFEPSVGQIASSEISHLHFNAWGNDFWGLLVWKSVDEALPGEPIQIKTSADSETVFCSKKVKGLYYNSQRGERLWPLDEQTFSTLGFSSSLSLNGGLYTACSTGGSTKDTDAYWMGIYGYLTHEFNDIDYALLAGTSYDGINNNVLSSSPLSPTLQRFDNKIPLGILYDYNGGIALVGCKLTDSSRLMDVVVQLNTSGVNNVFEYSPEGIPQLSWTLNTVLDCSNAGMTIDQLLILKIQWLIGLSDNSTAGLNVSTLWGNEADSKTQYFASVNVNNATLVNNARRRAEELCKGGRVSDVNPSTASDVLCWEWENINRTVSSTILGNKTLFVRGGSITLTDKMTSASTPLNIFIDWGNLLLGQGSSYMIWFDDRGYPASPSVFSGLFLKGNFIINGLIGSAVGDSIQNKLLIHGKFTSLNTYDVPSSARVIQVQDVVNSSIMGNQIDLQKVFSWRCNYGTGTDGTPCPSGEFANAPLAIINQNFPSKLID